MLLVKPCSASGTIQTGFTLNPIFQILGQPVCVFCAHRWQGSVILKKRRIRTKFKENIIEIFQLKKKKKMSVVGLYTGENGWEVVRW